MPISGKWSSYRLLELWKPVTFWLLDWSQQMCECSLTCVSAKLNWEKTSLRMGWLLPFVK